MSYKRLSLWPKQPQASQGVSDTPHSPGLEGGGKLLVFDLSVAALQRRAAILLCGLLAAIVSVEGKSTKSEVFSPQALLSWMT